MRAIIDGKRYDTEKATYVATRGHSYPSDFRHYAEDLYRTARGRWFLSGCGGPLSRYAETIGQNQWSGGRRIVPLSEDDARLWLEGGGHLDELETYFAGSIADA